MTVTIRFEWQFALLMLAGYFCEIQIKIKIRRSVCYLLCSSESVCVLYCQVSISTCSISIMHSGPFIFPFELIRSHLITFVRLPFSSEKQISDIQPSISYLGARLWGQQPNQRSPGLLLPSHLLQPIQGDR